MHKAEGKVEILHRESDNPMYVTGEIAQKFLDIEQYLNGAVAVELFKKFNVSARFHLTRTNFKVE